jgi:hypothetical protein
MFLKGLPHLCDKMKRLTSKDVKKLQKDDAVLPDFYALSRDFPLPDAAGDPFPSAPISLPAIATVSEMVVDSIRSMNGPLINPSDTSNQKRPGILGPIGGLLSSFGSAAPSQQTGQDSHASMLGAFAALNKLSNQVTANGTGNELVSSETRRNEILQRMLQIAGASSGGSTPAPFATNESTVDVKSQLMSLINCGANKQELLPFPMFVGTNFQGHHAPAALNSSGQQGSSVTSNTISSDMLAILGQQVLNPEILTQMVSKPASRMPNSVKSPPSTFAMPVASPTAVILGSAGSVGIDLSSFLQQKGQPVPNSSVPSTEVNSVGSNGVLDLASLIRLSQSSNFSGISHGLRPQIPLNSGLQPSQIHRNTSSLPGNAESESTRNISTPRSIDLSTLLRTQQQPTLTTSMSNVCNGENVNVGLDLNALAALLDPNNVNNLRQQIQISSGQQQFAVVQPLLLNQLSTLVGGNNMTTRSQYPNTSVTNRGNPSDASSRGIDIQCLQQLLGQQVAPSSIASATSNQNINQLEAALKLLISNMGVSSANSNGNGIDLSIGNLLAGLQR